MTSETRAPVAYSSSSKARSRSRMMSVSPVAPGAGPAASSSASIWSMDSAFGSRCGVFGGRSRSLGSACSIPSRTRKRCSPRTDDCSLASDVAAGGGTADARSAAKAATSAGVTSAVSSTPCADSHAR